jgi:hypothetical protein
MHPRQAPEHFAPSEIGYPARTVVDEARGEVFLLAPMIDPVFAVPGNAYLSALYRPYRLEPPTAPATLAGWMLHLPWAKNPLPMNRSGSREGWRAKARSAAMVRDTALQIVQGRIPRQERIRVRLDWEVIDRRTRDEDNLADAAKRLVDGIRRAGVVDDDSRRYVIREMNEIHYGAASPARPAAFMRFWIWVA